MLSLRVALPNLPIVAAGSANHLEALLLPDGLRRLYVAEDNDPAGRRATASVMTRAEAVGIEAMRLAPVLGDFNDDLWQFGREALHAALRVQLAPEDVERFWMPSPGERASSLTRVIATDVQADLGCFRFSRRAAPLASERADRTGAAPGRQRLRATFFPWPSTPRGKPRGDPGCAHSSRDKKAVLAVLRCASAAGESPAVQARFVPALRRPRGREGRGRPAGDEPPMTYPPHNDDHEPVHAESPTAHLLAELQLYGHRPFEGEPDPRPLPEDRLVRSAIADTFDAFVSALQDTRLEPDLEDLLWGITNVLHRATDRIERELDDNEHAQQRSQREQDGSEVRSVELERLLAEGLTLIERRNAHEVLRDLAADAFEHYLRKPWRPHSGSMVSRRTLTATLIDSRDFIAARKRTETQVMLPAGPKVAFTGGTDSNDVTAIWAALDRVHAKHADMVLLHGGSAQGRRADRRQMGRRPQGRAGGVQARLDAARQGRPHSSATTRCSTSCQSGSWCSPAPVSRTTSPTRLARWASRCSTSAKEAARERRFSILGGSSLEGRCKR